MNAIKLFYAFLIFSISGIVFAQSSSLYITDQKVQREPVPYKRDGSGIERKLSLAIARASIGAVRKPEVKQFVKHDLIQVLIQESISSDMSSTTDTGKEYSIEGELADIPKIQLAKLIEMQLDPKGNSNPVKLGLDYTNEFKGDGSLKRKQTIRTSIQARVIDVKPNSTLVLQARKRNEVDGEAVVISLTGTCRVEDITSNNTILSNQLFDLELTETHTGELAKANKKGLLSKIVDFFFPF